MAIPNSPSDLVATVIDDDSIRCDWVDNSGDEDQFDLQYDTSPDFDVSPVTANYPAETTYAIISGLDPDTLYYFHVRATNGSGSSDWSNTDSARTYASPPVVTTAVITITATVTVTVTVQE